MAEGPGSLFERYDPEGALGGLFAPAYIAGNPQSAQAVQAWQAQQRPVTSEMIDELRMPEAYRNPPGTNPDQPAGQLSVGGGNVYGEGRIPTNVRFGDPRGRVDPALLRRAAMGGRYDVQAQRNAIAQRVIENQQAEAAYRQAYADMMRNLGQQQQQQMLPGGG